MPDAAPIKLNSGTITAQITVVDDTLRDLERHATGLSLDAVSGDDAAIEELTKIDREIARAKATRVALERAQAQAAVNEQAELAAIEAAKRAKHHEVARQHAAKLVEISARADKIVADFKVVLKELSEIERAIHVSLNAAGVNSNNGMAGRNDLAAIAVSHIDDMMNGRDQFQNRSSWKTRTISGWVNMAWGDLISPGDDI